MDPLDPLVAGAPLPVLDPVAPDELDDPGSHVEAPVGAVSPAAHDAMIAPAARSASFPPTLRTRLRIIPSVRRARRRTTTSLYVETNRTVVGAVATPLLVRPLGSTGEKKPLTGLALSQPNEGNRRVSLAPSRPNAGSPLPSVGRGIPALTCADPSEGNQRVPQGSRLPNGEIGLPRRGRALPRPVNA